MTDEELIRVYFPIQPSYCFEILYKRYHQKIYQQCLQLTRNAEQAKDFSQDIFMKVFHKLGTFQERSRFATAPAARLDLFHCPKLLPGSDPTG